MTISILYDNKADSATLAASTTAGSMAVDNLLTDIKTEPWRATADTATLTLTWSQPVVCSAAVLAACNLTPLATLRARGYAHADDADPAVDTGARAACGYQPLGHFHWGAHPLGVNAYTANASRYGSYGRVYFPPTLMRKLVLDIADADNPDGYVQAARLIAGDCWTPEFDASAGAELTVNDETRNERSAAADLRTERGATWRSLRLNLEYLQDADRLRLYEILRGNGMSRGLFISLFPRHLDVVREQTHQVWGKLARGGSQAWTYFNATSAPLDIEEF